MRVARVAAKNIKDGDKIVVTVARVMGMQGPKPTNGSPRLKLEYEDGTTEALHETTSSRSCDRSGGVGCDGVIVRRHGSEDHDGRPPRGARRNSRGRRPRREQSINALVIDALSAELDRVKTDKAFMNKLRSLRERDKEILDRLAK
jgi:hypothetical protein